MNALQLAGLIPVGALFGNELGTLFTLDALAFLLICLSIATGS